MSKIPGVEYVTSSGKSMYVDVFWALELQSKRTLDEILMDNDRGEKLKKLCCSDFMKRAYSIADYLHHSHNSSHQKCTLESDCDSTLFESISTSAIISSNDKPALEHKSSFIDWYYHSLSPAVVPWLLDHPNITKVLHDITLFGMKKYMDYFHVPLLSDTDVFKAKRNLATYKNIQYDVDPVKEYNS